jgi:hypothetical protein
MNLPDRAPERNSISSVRVPLGDLNHGQSINLSHDDVLTLAGMTLVGPGLGKSVRERFVAIATYLLQKHGLRAFEMPKRAAAIHEAGHVVINSVLGLRTTNVLIDHINREGKLFWTGDTACPEMAFVDTPDAPAGYETLLNRARTTYAGIGAEELYAGEDRREGSSLDEVVMSQILTDMAASHIDAKPETLWKDEVVMWCRIQLNHNREAVAAIAAALTERKRLKGKALRELCAKVQAMPSLEERWPDIHDHTAQLRDAGILPSEEDALL